MMIGNEWFATISFPKHIFIGSMMLVKLYKKNKKINIELGPSASMVKKEGDPESEGLMEQESAATQSTA